VLCSKEQQSRSMTRGSCSEAAEDSALPGQDAMLKGTLTSSTPFLEPPSFLFYRYWVSYPGCEAAGTWSKLVTSYLLLRFKISWTIGWCKSELPKFKKCKFRDCKSVHHHTFKQINQPDASIPQIYCSSFKYSSTCFGHPLAHHHQEPINCSSRLWFTH
jgi:hypothetical protein